ncbi:M48 family metallopeptidase [Candidatus Endomicrobiellum trichonymphae]|uniref:Peptidase M48 family n=1 Tax=Endomicrobium trichonymphae TaxID=1408204 RepID=B1GZZ7_ENDTX|nr:M48 family metallopeptidase [Candidatus Endomicrobium trichonymphae]BAG13829.1 peptidase M48 family [Candidatus Endomicrobium trichonymphae]
MNIYTLIMLFFIIAVYLVETAANLLNVKNISNNIPPEFDGYFDREKYSKAQEYLKANTKLSVISSTFFLTAQIIFIVLKGFNYVNTIAVSFSFGTILTGLVFAGIVFSAFEILKIPFSVYSVFIIEENFGFNKMNVKTFISDLLKSWIITAIIGAVIFAAILWLFANVYRYAWLYAFAAIVIFELFITFIAPVTIMPLFNKYTSLEDGELKNSIEEYAKKENFKMKGLFKMDGSKRSTKSNAFFTGFGKFRRIVLFDTLIQKHTVDGLTSILAHEMGHFKLGHIVKHIIFSSALSGIMLFIFSLLIDKAWLYDAFFMRTQDIYAGIIFFSFLYAPVSLIISPILSYFSRKHEYEADLYSITTYRKPQAMINALKKLSVDNMSNLYPHKFKVFLEYSHPPVLERIKAINRIKLG